MNININEVVAEMMSAIKGSVANDWPLVRSSVDTYFDLRKQRLELLASMRISNQISEEFFNLRIHDEKSILESEMHSINVMSKVIAQNAANAAIDVFQKAVMAILKTVL